MEFLSVLFSILWILSFWILIAGLIKPTWVLRWGEKRDRKTLLKISLPIIFISLMLSGLFAPDETSDTIDVDIFSVKSSVGNFVVSFDKEVTLTGNIKKNKSSLRLNKELVSTAQNGDFKIIMPLKMGRNDFIFTYKDTKNLDKIWRVSIRRVTKKQYVIEEKKRKIEEAEEEEIRIAEQIKKEQEEKKALELVNRKKLIESQFSPWDGSHRNLEQYIKTNMNDPDSYEHVKTLYWDKGKYLIVNTQFRGKNAFGGKVLDYIKANITLNGRIIKTYK